MVGTCSRACVEGRLSLGEGEEEGEDRSQDAKRGRRFDIPRSRQQARNTQYPVAGAFRNPMNGVFSLVTPRSLLY
jgi:hypothetical protein